MSKRLTAIVSHPQAGLAGIIAILGLVLTIFGPRHADRQSGQMVSNFLNPNTLMQVGTDTSFFAIMAVGATMVIISGGIDLSIGSIYALSGVVMALVLRSMGDASPGIMLVTSLGICMGVGLLCGLLNGTMVCRLGVHPFIITLGTMWIFRGIAFVSTGARSILVPDPLIQFAKASLGLPNGLTPLPLLIMLVVAAVGAVYLTRTTMGRRIFAVGGNAQAARYAGLPLNPILTGVYVLSGLAAGIAAFVGSTYYGSATSGDATGYELYVVASAVVGGASLSGGKGSAVGALLGALLIVMIRQAIRTLGLDTNYEWIIIGVAIIVAVVLDRWSARLAERRLATASQQ